MNRIAKHAHSLIAGRRCLALLALLALAGCSRKADYIAVFQDVKGLEPGARVMYDTMKIGEVVGEERQMDGLTRVSIKVAKHYQTFVREECVFAIRTDKAGSKTRVYVRLIGVPSKDKPLLPRGSIVRGAESEVEDMEPAFIVNWKINIGICVFGLAALLWLMRGFRKKVKGVMIWVSLGISVAMAAAWHYILGQVLSDFVPFEWRPDLLAFVIVLVGTYLLMGLLMVAIMRPFFQAIRRPAKAKQVLGRRLGR